VGILAQPHPFFFNLIPIPPLTARISSTTASAGLGARLSRDQRFGILPLLALMLLAPG